MRKIVTDSLESVAMVYQDDDGSPSKLSRRRRKNGVKPIRHQMKISLCLFAVSVYFGLYFQRSYKMIENMLTSTIEKLDITTTMSIQERLPIKYGIVKNATTLALLFPPGMIGGYRNQVIRFIAFVVYAKENNITQILLPSVLWTTKIVDPGIDNNNRDQYRREFPIPFDWIFDVDHWNTYYYKHLPILVDSDQMSSSQNLDCWIPSSEMKDMYHLQNATSHMVTTTIGPNMSRVFYYRYDQPLLNLTDRTSSDPIYINHLQRAVLLQGVIRPIAANVTIPILTNQYSINPRQHNFAPETKHCTNPQVYGGGKQAGVLWNSFISYQKRASEATSTLLAVDTKMTTSTFTNKSFVPFDTDIWMYRALRPATIWRDVADTCIREHAPTGTYIALHARVEIEMMGHICGNGMEKNLSKIVNQVYQLYEDQPQSEKLSISAFFIAVSRDGMKVTNYHRNSPFRTVAEDNWRALNRITQQSPNVSDELLPAFECGEQLLQRFYATNPSIPDHGTLLQSVINFHIAVSSAIFIGVAQSSYSTDILTTRYWLGKGSSNYRYTPEGIEPVENSGLPIPHSNCKKKSKFKFG